MNFIFSILSIVYIASIFILANSPVVSTLAPFNPYSLLHIPLYGILTILLIFSFFPFNFKAPVPNVLNDPNHPNVTNEHNDPNVLRIFLLTHLRINLSTRNRFFISGIIALIVGIADEIYQSFIPTRHASILDVFLDAVGIALTLFLVYHIYKKQILFQL